MPAVQTSSHLPWKFAACGLSIWVLSAAVCRWLTTEQYSSQLLPVDSLQAICQMLGAEPLSNSPKSSNELSSAEVFPKFIVVAIVLTFLARFRSAAHMQTALNQTTFVGFSVVIWWAFEWFGAFPALRVLSDFAVGSLPIWVAVTLGVLAWVWLRALLAPNLWFMQSPEMVNHSPIANRQKHASRWQILLLTACAVAWFGVSFWMNACLYEQLLIPHGDSAMYEEHLWNIWHGKGFRSYLDQGLFLGEHIQVIHLLLLPLHILWPSHLLLELAESAALASCVWPLFRIVRRHSGSKWAASLMGIAWLLYFPMHYLDIAIDQKTFRPIVLGLPFLFWMIESAETGKYGWTIVHLALALSAKEDVALITCPLLAVLAWRSQWMANQQNCSVRQIGDTTQDNVDASRSSDAAISEQTSQTCAAVCWMRLALLSVGSLAYLLIVVLIVIPWFRSGDAVHYSRYFGDLGSTPGDLIRNAVQQPGRIFSTLISARTLLYATVFLAPLCLLPTKRAWALLAGGLTFGMLSLLEFGDGGLPVPYHHFHAPLLPVLFWASALALKLNSTVSKGTKLSDTQPHQKSLAVRGFRISNFSWPRKCLPNLLPADWAFLCVCCCATTAAFGSLMPCGFLFWSESSGFGRTQLFQPQNVVQRERAAMAEEVERLIPPDAIVAATDFIHTRLTHRKRSYDYSDYLRAVNNYQPGVPADTEYIVIDTRHKYSKIQSADDVPELRQGQSWELLPDTTNGTFLILKRVDSDVEHSASKVDDRNDSISR